MTVDHFRMGKQPRISTAFCNWRFTTGPPPMAWLEAVAATNGKVPWVPSSNRAEPEPSPVQRVAR